MIPLIPILAIAAIAGGIGTLAWYSKLSKDEQRKANSLAMQMFGRGFEQLAENQKKKIRDRMNG